MMVRLGFAVAAYLSHDILAIDEILAVGDLDFRQKAINKVKDLKNSHGRTIIFVSHNMNSIQQLCTKVGLLNKGQLIKEGEPSEMIIEYNKIIREIQLNEHTMIYDRKFRRGNGNCRFSKIEIKNDQGKITNVFKKDENINIFFNYVVYENIKDLTIKIAFKSSKTSEPIFSSIHKLSEKELKKGHKGKALISIEPKNVMGKSFDILFWLGSSGVKGQCDVIDGLTAPIIIDDKNLIFDDWGYFKVPSKIKNLVLDD
tara:strand:- start:263 stop:1033 length:771 start_codon:yes stop_codon:yes gene_type:complete